MSRFSLYQSYPPLGCLNAFFFISRRVSVIKRRVSQKGDNVLYKSAEHCEKLCETQREIFFFTLIRQPLNYARYFLILFALSCCSFVSQQSFAQDSTLLLDKPGQFNFMDLGIYKHSNCGYTSDDSAANYQKIITIIDTLLTNPVLSSPKGFDLLVLTGSWNCDPKNGYGIPVEIGFDFCTWSLVDGKEVRWSKDPLQWLLEMNRLKSFSGGGFQVITGKTNKIKQGFNKEQWEEASAKLDELFFMPGTKEKVGKGLDRYNKDFIIAYNPERPAYWVHVTIREVFGVLFDYWRKHPDETTSTPVVKMLEREYAGFSQPELDGYAYYGGPGTFSHIGSDRRQLPVMRVNPAYWNKNLPRSAIQILSFHCKSDKYIIRKEKEEQLKNNNGFYHLSRFTETLDPIIFTGFIDK
jgi:hypothetical protein